MRNGGTGDSRLLSLSLKTVLALGFIFVSCRPLPPRDAEVSPAEPRPVSREGATSDRPARRAGRDGEETLLRVVLAEESPQAELSRGGAVAGGEPGPADERWTVRPGGPGELLVVNSAGERSTVASPLIWESPNADGWVALDGRRYRGSIVVRRGEPGSLMVVNELEVEAYLRGVVPLEIGRVSLELLEAVKAQAVAARTYALMKRGQYEERGFDLYASVRDQVYGGMEAEWEITDRAIAETGGEVLAHRGRLVRTYYHSCCGGKTARIEEVWEKPPASYLVGVNDWRRGGREEESYCRSSRHFRWEERWSGAELARALERNLPGLTGHPVEVNQDNLRDIKVESRGRSGRVKWVSLRIGDENYRVFGDKLRWLLRPPDGGGAILRSVKVDLEISRRGGRVVELVARGGGNGHGVGMCQVGALAMARQGKSYREILSHYYPGTRIGRFTPRAFPVVTSGDR